MNGQEKTGGELFIVDNSDETWVGLKYLQDWTEIASTFDIASGYFEIGALLTLDGKWQKLGRIRILMGDQATARTGQPVWNFHIGGYQVCEKWLKDRKGRTLSADEITHYHKIVVVLSETIRLMSEIDAVIETHGGWPIK
jgi:hypothetical protein